MTLNSAQNNLLNNLILDEKKVDRNLYSAGDYWNYKTKKIIFWLKKKGIKNFRSLDSGVGTSYTDNIVRDIRNELGFKGRIISKITKFPFIKKIFEEQLKINNYQVNLHLKYKQKFFENNVKTKYLISNYKIDKSIDFECISKFKFNGNEYSTHYLEMCDRIDYIKKFINFNQIKSYMEIGGGFGSNIHLLLQNYSNIKKIIYVDIVPNLFVGTEYLKKIYGDSVKDYNLVRNSEEIKFSNSEELEIICIPPWKLKNFISKVDSFHNSASFQEMTKKQVENYYSLIKGIVNLNSISLIVYKGWNKNGTFSPEEINSIFKNKLKISEYAVLGQEDNKLVYLVS